MSRNTKIFLAVFTVFLIGVTVLAIIYKNSNKNISDESRIIIESGQKVPEFSNSDVNKNVATKGASLEDTYSMNSITYDYEEYKENDVNVKLVQISGLSNSEIQNNINTDIKERIKKILDSNNFKNNSDSTANVNTSIEANFSDVLSIKIVVKFSESFTKSYGLNYRLDNGERLKINDLFIFNAPKKNIITESAYRSFAMKYYTDEGMSNDFYTNIEGEVLSFLIDYDAGKITEFSFNPYTIELYREGKTVEINMVDNYQYISIYSIFISSSSLYEKKFDNLAKDIPIFMVRPKDVLYDLYEKINSTCILDVIIYSDEELSTTEKKVVDKYKKDLVKRLSVVKSEKNVYYSNYIKVSKAVEDEKDILVFEENECFAISEEGKFLEDIYNKILSAERNKDNISFTKSKIYVLDEQMLEENVGIKKYDIETGEEVVEREEPEEDDEQPATDETENVNQNTVDNTTDTNTVTENTGTEIPEENVGNEIENLPAANITTQVTF